MTAEQEAPPSPDTWEQHRQQCIDVLCGYLRLHYDPSAGVLKTVAVERDLPADDERQPAKETPTYEHLPNDREVRLTIVSTIARHLREPSNGGAPIRGMATTSTSQVQPPTAATSRWRGPPAAGHPRPGDQVTFSPAAFVGGQVTFSRAAFVGGQVTFDEARFGGIDPATSTGGCC